MAFTKLDTDLNIISALSDEPNDTDGLTAAELKAKFDEASNTIKDFLNDSLIDELEADSGAGNIGVDTSAMALLSQLTNLQDVLEELYTMAQQSAQGVIGDGAVTTPKLADHAVTNAKMSRKTDTDGAAVKGENVEAGAIDTTELANGAVTDAKTDFSAGLAPAGPLILTSGVHYFANAAALPVSAETGQLAFVKV